ncbi:MAG: 50S ribosomal protein L35 [Candidatus Yanofskybacteria bacterium]|nr:50S ribosomal protein L35 [Candidatus Yanofskybacteria bacterium]
MPKLKLKSSKSALKRFKISSSGKKQHRHSRINHFNARQDGSARRNNRGQDVLAKPNKKDIRNLMPYV